MSFNKKPKTINPNEVDPSVYYYDEVYDEMQAKEKAVELEKVTSSFRGASKYIGGLKETAELRKTEKEIRKFKKYARDREKAELDGELEGKDVYITSSYKKRLKEIESLEKEKRKRLDLEKDNRMNFIKIAESTKLETYTENSPNKTSEIETREDKKEESEKKKAPESSTGSKKVLKTIEERKEYLGQLLAKRTVGKVFDEARQRYLERKAACR